MREVAPLRVAHHRHEHAAIGGFEYVVHAPWRFALGAHGLGRGAGQLELRDELRDQQKIVFEQAGPHMAAAPRGVAVVQCGQGAHHAERAAQDVVDRRGHALRRVGAAVDIGQAAHHLHHFIQRRPVLVRPRQKALERHVDQPGVFGRQRFIVQPVLRQAAVAEVLHHHVGLQRQLAHQLLALCRLQIDRQALLVAVEHRKVAAARAFQPARAVTVYRFHLDHVGAQIGQRQARGRPHDHVRQFQHLDAAQRQFSAVHEG
ncbi:hypothetical protein D3C72_906480 [compost metagenome]